MKFLTDYPTLLKLQQAFPGIAIDEGFLTMANAKYALEVAVADVHLSRLLQKYPHQEVLFGLRILLGQEKGQNQYSKVLGDNIVLKYGRGLHGDRSEREPAQTVQARILRCVGLARAVLRTVGRIGTEQPELLDPVLEFHFKCKRGDPPVADILESYRKIGRGLSGLIRIAEVAKPITAAGYVTWKKIENAPDEDDVPSPFQTVGGRRGKAYRAGSVHLDLTVFGTGPSANLHRLWTDLALAGLIIHEASHKFCFTEDHAYCHDGDKYTALSRELMLDNADSYGYAAISLHHGRLIKDTSDEAVTLR